MTAKLPADPQMTDVFGRFQSPLPPLRETSGPAISTRKKAMLSTAAVLLGGGATFAAIHFDRIRDYVAGNETATSDEVPPASGNEVPVDNVAAVRHHTPSAVQNGTIVPTENIAIAGQVREHMRFGEAYATAREEVGPGGIFSWHGQVYNTYTVEEWQGLSLAQRQEFLSDVGYRPAPSTEVVAGAPPVDEVPGTLNTGESTLLGGSDPVEDGKIETNEGDAVPEPAYFDLVINGRPALGIDDDHDGVANAIVFLDEETNNLLAFVDAEGDIRIDTVIQFDATSQQIVGQEAIEVPFLAEISKLEALSDVMDDTINQVALVADTEENVAYDDDNDYTHEEGYVNDAELPEMD